MIKYLLDSKHKGLKVEPVGDKFEWVLILFSDSDWAGDKDDRRSISGYMLFLNGVLIAWRSKAQRVVALSSSEAEFYACGEAVREIPFVVQILLFIGVPVKLPIEVWVDNIGAIFMSENATSSHRTRHMNTRYRYVEQLQDEGLIKIKFVPSAKNVADIATKNVNGATLRAHEGKLVADRSFVESS